MPITLPLSIPVRRVLGLGAAIALAATVAIWISANKKIIAGKKKEEEEDEVHPEEVKVIEEIVVEDKMEVLVSQSAEDFKSSSSNPDPEVAKSDDEALSEEVIIETDVQPASRSWTDLVEEELEEDESNCLKQSILTAKSQPQLVPSDSRKSMSSDSGVVSPAENVEDQQQLLQQHQEHKQPEKKKDLEGQGGDNHYNNTSRKHSVRQTSGGNAKGTGKQNSSLPSCSSSDSGQGSEAGDGLRFTYHFNVPCELTGKLIGAGGSNIENIRRHCHCEISVLRPHEYSAALSATYCNDIDKFSRRFIKLNLLQDIDEPPRQYNETQVCVIEGSRNAIDRCLEYLREMFPLESHPQFTLQQINKPKPVTFSSEPETNVYEQQHHQQLMLAQNALHEVLVSAVVSAGHIFVQQPSHPSFLALPRLDQCMTNVYTKCQAPEVSRNEIRPSLVCAAPCDNKWYRVQVVSYDAVTDFCDVKYLDYGGYSTIEAKDLRKIRTDFMKLPFQAIECYLANVVPLGSVEWSFEAGIVLQELVTQVNQVISCRMLGVAEDYTPMVHIYSTDLEGNTKLLNRELVDRGGAAWIEHSGTVAV